MERDAGISHGASSFIRERLMRESDAYQTVFCKTCGAFAINDSQIRKYKKCPLCGDDQHFGRATIPYAYKLLIHLLGAMGINLRPEFVDSDEYYTRVFRRHGPEGPVDINEIRTQLDEADEGLEEEEEQFQEEFDNEEFGLDLTDTFE